MDDVELAPRQCRGEVCPHAHGHVRSGSGARSGRRARPRSAARWRRRAERAARRRGRRRGSRGRATVTECPRSRRAAATPATCSLMSCGCDHANGVTRQIRSSFGRPTKRNLVVLEWRPERAPARTRRRPRAARAAGWEVDLLRTKPLVGTAGDPARPRGRVHVRTARDGRRARRAPRRGRDLRPGARRPRARPARGAGRRLRDRRAARRRRAARARRRGGRAARRGRAAARASARAERAPSAEGKSFDDVAAELERALHGLARGAARGRALGRPARRPRLDRRRPAHAHLVVVRLRGRRRASSSTTPRPKGSARSQSPTTTSSAARSRRSTRARPRPDRHPGRGGEDRRPGRGDRPLPREEIPRGMSFADTIAAIREQGGLVYVPHPFDRMHAIPDPATLHRHLADIDVFEVYNARLLFEAHNDEALRFARKYDLTMGAGSDAHVAPGRRHGRAADAGVRRPGGVPDLAAQRRDPAPAEVARLPPVPEVDGPGQGKGPLGENRTLSLRGRRRDDRRDLRAVPRQGDHRDHRARHEIARAAADGAVPRAGPAIRSRTIFLLKYGPQPQELQEGVAFHGRAGHALIKSLAAAARRPARGLRHELRQVRRRGRRRGRGRGSRRELRIVQPKLVVVMGDDALEFLNELEFPLAQPLDADAGRAAALHADDRGARRRPTSTPRSTSSPRRRASGTPSRRSARGGPSCRPTERVARGGARRALGRARVYYRSTTSLPSRAALVGRRASSRSSLIPAVFALVWLALPLLAAHAAAPGRRLVAVALAVAARGRRADVARELREARARDAPRLVVPDASSRRVSWVVLVALIIPWVDAYSVWRGPDEADRRAPRAASSRRSRSRSRSPASTRRDLGLPDLLFFALFLAATASASACAPAGRGSRCSSPARDDDRARPCGRRHGLPALPAISLGFLAPERRPALGGSRRDARGALDDTSSRRC